MPWFIDWLGYHMVYIFVVKGLFSHLKYLWEALFNKQWNFNWKSEILIIFMAAKTFSKVCLLFIMASKESLKFSIVLSKGNGQFSTLVGQFSAKQNGEFSGGS